MDPYTGSCWFLRVPGQLDWDGPLTLAECGERKALIEHLDPRTRGRIETRLSADANHMRR